MADHGLAAPRTRGRHSGDLSTGLSEANLVTKQSNSTIFYDLQHPNATSAEEVRNIVGNKRALQSATRCSEPGADRATQAATQNHNGDFAVEAVEHIPLEEPAA